MMFNETMKRVLGSAALMMAGACTIVIPKPDPPPPPPPVVVIVPGEKPPELKPVEAHALFVMNLHQSSANLAPSYVAMADALMAGLGQRGISVTRWAVVPTYPGNEGLRLLLGGAGVTQTPTTGTQGVGGISGTTGAGGSQGGPPLPVPAFDVLPPDLPPVPPLPDGSDITTTLQRLAASGLYDGVGITNEAEGVVRTGAHLVDARLPYELGGLDGAAFFDRPRSLFLVVYLQALSRRCSLNDANCLVDGRSPADIFTESTSDGIATWLRFATGGMPIDQVVHVAISTKEGETPDAFRARCGAVNGFPKNLFDVMEPSPALYFNPLISALNAAHPGTGQSADLCDMLGELGLEDPTRRITLNKLVNSVAAMAGPATDTTTTPPPPGGRITPLPPPNP